MKKMYLIIHSRKFKLVKINHNYCNHTFKVPELSFTFWWRKSLAHGPGWRPDEPCLVFPLNFYWLHQSHVKAADTSDYLVGAGSSKVALLGFLHIQHKSVVATGCLWQGCPGMTDHMIFQRLTPHPSSRIPGEQVLHLFQIYRVLAISLYCHSTCSLALLQKSTTSLCWLYSVSMIFGVALVPLFAC